MRIGPCKPFGRPLLLVAFACLLAACSSSNNNGNKSNAANNAANATKPVASSIAPAPGAAGTAQPGSPTSAATRAAATAAPASTSAAGSPAAGAAPGDPGAAALAAAGGKKIGGSVNVLGTWGGSEQDSFLAMVKPFEDATGVKVNYEGTRDLNAVLTTRVQGGNPPELAGLPGPGQMAQFAQQGKLVDLDSVLDMSAMKQQYPESWLQLAQVGGKQVGIFIKVALKGPIWYDPKTLSKFSTGQTPKTWDELLALTDKIAQSGTTPWCIGMESGAASGWPGTDWLEDIVLRQAGPDVYDQWYQGKIKWTSDQIKQAWQSWGKIVANSKDVFGGSNTVLSTNFGDAGTPMFSNPPKCYLMHQGSFITDFFVKNTPGLKPITDFNFFMFPDIDPKYTGSAEVAGDLFGMFKDTPQARALIKYLATPEAQAIWVKRGGALSPNKLVSPEVYPDELAKEQAQIITTTKTAKFDASDLMPDAMNTAFYKAVLDYIQNPGNLDSILANLDKVQADAYKQ
ncbi:MAG TPA: ABC transporter substrate-binding protein [Dehalococcoidia bacterium]|nr:ABC transporter substrate-binding protein [Dehalococcoidia bacterium]